MAGIFVDTACYVAILIPTDDLHVAAIDMVASLRRGDQLTTSEPVFVEVLAYVANRGSEVRGLALALLRDVQSDPRTNVIGQTPALFESGLKLYERRSDKGYSLTDCMSMSICKRLGITDVLTHDHHFQQEGFTILL